MPKHAKKPINQLRPRQQKALAALKANLGKEKPKSLGTILRDVGYSESVAKNPKLVIEALDPYLQEYIDQLRDKRRSAISHITEDKLENSSAKDLANIASTLTKDEQLLTGKATERIEGSFSLSDLFDKAVNT